MSGDQVVEEGGARVFLEESAAADLDDKVLDAWVEVGVLAAGDDGASGSTGVVFIRRSGGFAGIVTEREIDLASDPSGTEAAALLRRVDFDRLPTTPPQPDRFACTVRIGDRKVRLNEQDLTPELIRLIDLIPGPGLARAPRDPRAEITPMSRVGSNSGSARYP